MLTSHFIVFISPTCCAPFTLGHKTKTDTVSCGEELTHTETETEKEQRDLWQQRKLAVPRRVERRRAARRAAPKRAARRRAARRSGNFPTRGSAHTTGAHKPLRSSPKTIKLDGGCLTRSAVQVFFAVAGGRWPVVSYLWPSCRATADHSRPAVTRSN